VCFAWYAYHRGDVPGSGRYLLKRGCRGCFQEAIKAEYDSRPFSLRMALGLLNGGQLHGRDGFCERCWRPVVVLTQTKYPGEDYERVIYCSDACRDARPERDKVCEVCSKEFTATRSHQKTCSSACRQKAYRERKKAAGKGTTKVINIKSGEPYDIYIGRNMKRGRYDLESSPWHIPLRSPKVPRTKRS